MLYIGETGRKLTTCFHEHVGDIRNCRITKSQSQVAAHFNHPGHSIDDLSVCGLLRVPDQSKRKVQEAKIIHALGTLHPFGLNLEEVSLR